MLTGTPALPGRRSAGVVPRAHRPDARRRRTSSSPAMPPPLSAIVLKLLAKVAEERYQSAEGLKADLERCVDGVGQRGGDRAVRARAARRLRPLPAPAAALRPRARRSPRCCRRFERVGPGPARARCWSAATPASASPRWCTSCTGPWCGGAASSSRGKFDQFQRDIPYATLAQAFRGLVQQLLAGATRSSRAGASGCTRRWEGNGQVLVDMVPELELWSGRSRPAPELPPTEAQHRFHRVFQQLPRSLRPAEHPLVRVPG